MTQNRNTVLAREASRHSWDGGWFGGTALAAIILVRDEPFEWSNVFLIGLCVGLAVYFHMRAQSALRGVQ